MRQVTAILVAYNSAGVIERAIASVKDDVAECVVVDNASTEPLQCQGARVLRQPHNLGFGVGCNVGLAEVRTPFALLLNPDAALQPGALESMLACMHAWPDVALVAPLLVDEQGKPHISYKRSVFAREAEGGGLEVVPEGPVCAEFLSGAVWLVRMDAWRAVGGFDPNIFLYYEDDDVCLRLRQAGYGLVLNPQACAVHVMGTSTPASAAVQRLKHYHLAWSRVYIEQKYHGAAAARALLARMRWVVIGKMLGYALLGKRAKFRRYQARLAAIYFFSSQMKGKKAGAK